MIDVPVSTCSRCREAKSRSEFWADSRRPSGVQSMCKACRRETRNPQWHLNWKARNPGRAAESNRQYRKRRRPRYQNRTEHDAVQRAIAKGVLVRPQACERCLAPCKPLAHHPDYSKPLDVVWVCPRCHFKEHAHDMQ